MRTGTPKSEFALIYNIINLLNVGKVILSFRIIYICNGYQILILLKISTIIPLIVPSGAQTSIIESSNLTQWYTNDSFLQDCKLSQFFLCDLLRKSQRFFGQVSTFTIVPFVPKHISSCNKVKHRCRSPVLIFFISQTTNQTKLTNTKDVMHLQKIAKILHCNIFIIFFSYFEFSLCCTNTKWSWCFNLVKKIYDNEPLTKRNKGKCSVTI